MDKYTQVVGRQEPTTQPGEKIETYTLLKQQGEQHLDVPKDADVFCVADDVELGRPAIRLWATVSSYDHATPVNPPMPRTFWVGTTKSILPSLRYPRDRFAKKYLGTAYSADGQPAHHVWEISWREKDQEARARDDAAAPSDN